MKYGLIGEKLPHSFSAVIHGLIGGYDYALKELAPGELEGFIREKAFCAINVTIPYKQAVIPFLDEISAEAAEIGAVNTVVNRGGRLCGFNTDIGGLKALIRRAGGLKGEKVLILGTGGTGKTAFAAAAAEGAAEVYKVSRSAKEGALSYEEAVKKHCDAAVIINTTPCGMFPDIDGSAIDLSGFRGLKSVVDVVYNPLRTRLVQEARALGAAAEGGLYMLVRQAVLASELFMGRPLDPDPTDGIYKTLLSGKENIVLTGMPGSGKSTVGLLLAKALGRPFYDTDDAVRAESGLEIADIFEKYGEERFRELETRAIKKLAAENGCVIATGGGAPLRPENVLYLKLNGRVYFLDRPVGDLLPTGDRPLARTAEAIKARYAERYGTYVSTADETVKVNGSAQSVAEDIERRRLS